MMRRRVTRRKVATKVRDDAAGQRWPSFHAHELISVLRMPLIAAHEVKSHHMVTTARRIWHATDIRRCQLPPRQRYHFLVPMPASYIFRHSRTPSAMSRERCSQARFRRRHDKLATMAREHATGLSLNIILVISGQTGKTIDAFRRAPASRRPSLASTSRQRDVSRAKYSLYMPLLLRARAFPSCHAPVGATPQRHFQARRRRMHLFSPRRAYEIRFDYAVTKQRYLFLSRFLRDNT